MATVASGPGNALDWVALYQVGGSTEVDWKFLNGSRTAPLSGFSNASVPIALPATPGTYLIRFYANNTVHAPGDESPCRRAVAMVQERRSSRSGVDFAGAADVKPY